MNYFFGTNGMADAPLTFMEPGASETNFFSRGEQISADVGIRILRNKLLNITLDWELTALTIDARRYKTISQTERESLRHSANTYRRCVAELNKILTSTASATCNRRVAP